MAALSDLGISVRIGERPNEVPDPIRFTEDRTHAAYDPEYSRRIVGVPVQSLRWVVRRLANGFF
jgi:Family of unknown function (DUF5996)